MGSLPCTPMVELIGHSTDEVSVDEPSSSVPMQA
jgi:hypothetical protein